MNSVSDVSRPQKSRSDELRCHGNVHARRIHKMTAKNCSGSQDIITRRCVGPVHPVIKTASWQEHARNGAQECFRVGWSQCIELNLVRRPAIVGRESRNGNSLPRTEGCPILWVNHTYRRRFRIIGFYSEGYYSYAIRVPRNAGNTKIIGRDDSQAVYAWCRR